jgi:hypothetical protein
MVLNHRLLLIRPGVWLLLLWWSFLACVTVSSLGQGVIPGRFVRVVLPYLMIGLGLGVAQAAACRGLRPQQIVTPIVLAGMINITWRIFHGFAFKGATLETARMEVFSPAMNPLIAYLGAALLLRPRFHWVNLIVAAVALGGVLISVTRGLIFPIAVAGALGAACFGLGLVWRVFEPAQIPRKLGAFLGSGLFAVALLVVVHLVSPVVLERWSERLFHHATGGGTSKDISWLTREAEAAGMMNILKAEPISFVCGKGMGAPYHWDPSYLPELYTVYPRGSDFSMDIWFNGHSVWTYTLFSSGVVGVAFHLAFFAAASVFGLLAVRRQSGQPDDETWLGFLPLFLVACLLSESLTSNQLAERLTGVMLGVAAGLPQALFLRRACPTARWPGRPAAAPHPLPSHAA